MGRILGDYQLVESLGEGGLGEAFLAKHTQTGAAAVVKLLHPERVGDPEAMQSYFDELRAVASLQHPGIVAVLDCGTAGDQAYVVMEEVDGEALDVELEERALLAPDRALGACKQIAEALSAVHAAGLLHGDLTSANVIISGDAFRVFDFASRHIPPAEDPSVYMAPEQYAGGLVGPHSDIYSLGILLYEMLTARVPFGDTNEEEAREGHLGQLPAPPSQIVRNITPHVEAVCLKALEKDPDNRYASMDEFAAALADPQAYVGANGGLDGFLSGGSTLALPGAPPPPDAVPAPVSMAKTMLGIAPIDAPAPAPAPTPGPTDEAPTVPVAAPAPAPAHAPDAPTEPVFAAPMPSTAPPTAQTVLAAPVVHQPAPAPAAARPRVAPAPAMAPADITDELEFVPKSRAPLIAAAVGAVVIVVGLIVVLAGGDDDDKDNNETEPVAGAVDQPAVAAKSAPPAPSIDAARAAEPPAPPVVTPDAAPAAPPAPVMVVLSVETDPAGAEVFVEGEAKSRGRAPVRIELEQGTSATLIARKRGHDDARKTVTADDHGTVSLALPEKRVASKVDRSSDRKDDRVDSKKDHKRRSKRKKKKHGRDDLLPPKL